jgi:hypothetical protein
MNLTVYLPQEIGAQAKAAGLPFSRLLRNAVTAELKERSVIMSRPTRVYFTVPDHYTIGREFETWDEAVACAHTKIREIDGCPGSWTRAWVDVRISNSKGDKALHREEITREALGEDERQIERSNPALLSSVGTDVQSSWQTWADEQRERLKRGWI